MDETESPSAVNVSRLDAAEIAAVGSSSFAEITAKLAQFSASLGPTGEALGRIARSAKAADDAQIVAIRHSVPYIPPNPVHESNRRLAELQALLQDQVQMATEREGAVEHARKAYFQALALKSVRSRRKPQPSDQRATEAVDPDDPPD